MESSNSYQGQRAALSSAPSVERPASGAANVSADARPAFRGFSDEAIIARIAAGDGMAFEEFYDRHATALFSLAVRIVGDAREAESVMETAMVLVWERAPAFDARLGRPLTWAIAIVRAQAVERRAALARTAHTESMPQPPASAKTGVAVAGARAAWLRLPDDQREALELAFFGGLGLAEIATRLGVPLEKVPTLVRHAMMELRDSTEGMA